jgi:D-galacturonate reductase
VDPLAYVQAASTFGKGDVAIIFTPDDTHFDIAKCCAERGMHVLVTKPIVKTLEDHLELSRLSALHSSLIGVEVRACEASRRMSNGSQRRHFLLHSVH